MSTIIKTPEGLFVHHRGKIDYTWIVKSIHYKSYKEGSKKKNRYGIISLAFIVFPDRFVGKKFRIKLEEVKHGTRSKNQNNYSR